MAKWKRTKEQTMICKKSLKILKGGNQNLYIEKEQTTQWPKEKVQKDKQRSTKHTYKTKDRVTRTPLKTRGELRYAGKHYTEIKDWATQTQLRKPKVSSVAPGD